MKNLAPRVLDELKPGVGHEFGRLVDGVWDGRVDPSVLEACRRRICALLGAPTDAGRHATDPAPAGPGDPAAAACVAFTEIWVVDPHAMTDEVAQRVRTHLDDAAAAAFTIGLATIEAEIRAQTAWETLR